MDMNEEVNKLKAYVRPIWLPSTCIGVVFFLLVIAFIKYDVTFGTIVILAIGMMFLISGLLTYTNYSSRIKRLMANNILTDVLEDFAQSRSVFGDRLRVGKRYMFGKRTGTIIAYGEIDRLYQYIHKTNFVEDRRKLIVVTMQGDELELCSLPLRGQANLNVTQLAAIVKQYNPDVEFGYKK